MNHKAIALAAGLLFALGAGAAEKVARVEVDLGKRTGAVRPELHSSSWRSKVTDYDGGGPEAMRKLNMKAWRSHDAALVESGQRVIDTHFIFPLLHLDAKNPSNYCFQATDNLIRRVREKDGLEVFYRMGSSIEHTSNADAVNTLDPGDHDKYAEVLAGIVRHYNRGWADGYRWNIRYWELFNEPDITPCWRGTRAGFVDLFVKCVKRLKDEFGDEIKVGGPAFAHVKEDYVRELLGACRKAGANPDFFSWHHYGSDPDVIVAQPAAVKKLVSSCGFGDMELILNEWHYLTDNKWDHLWTKADPEVFYHAYVGPASQGGIDSAAFTLTVESRFQDTCLDQSYFYGCGRESDNWGYYDRYERKFNKVYYAMQIMGEVVKGGRHKVACTSSEKAVTPFAAVSADGKRAVVSVADYKSGADEIEISFANAGGLRPQRVRVLDFARDLLPVEVKQSEKGTLRLPKRDRHSACYLVELGEVVSVVPPAADTNRTASVTVDFGKRTGEVRPELHSASWRSMVHGVDPTNRENVRRLNLKAWRTHDAPLVDRGQRSVDTHFIFPLMHLDARNPSNYYFKATDNLLRQVREQDGLEVFYRLGSSIEHTTDGNAVNTADPPDHDKYAEVLAGIVRHYNRGWADGYRWNIKYWELFNEPDAKACWRGTRESFVDLFVKCLKRLKDEFGDEIKVGGPALTHLNGDYARELFAACKKADVRPDFLSWHDYGNEPEKILVQPAEARALAEECGFGGIELILNEWHYITDPKWTFSWTTDPEEIFHLRRGPGSQLGIDSAAYTLTVEAGFQDTCLDQSYFYGCGIIGNWGFGKPLNKTYFAVQVMGEVVKGARYKVASASATKGVKPFAAVSADGRRAYVAVADYKSGKELLEIRFANLAGFRLSHVRILDWDRDLERMDVRLADNGVLRLPKATSRSACFLIELEK